MQRGDICVESTSDILQIKKNYIHIFYLFRKRLFVLPNGGHFPNDPITPGVCVVQIAIDLFSHLRLQEYILSQAKNIKFIQIIRPHEYEQVEYRLSWEPLDDGNFAVKVVVAHNDTVFSKMSVILTSLNKNK